MSLILEAYKLPNLFPVFGPLIDWLFRSVGNLGIAIILFTLIIKTVLLPLDFWNRSSMKRNQLKMQAMKPKLDRLKKKYENDQVMLNQKMQQLYKKEGYSMFGACIPTIFTMVMFILVFQALQGYLTYNLVDAYNKMYAAYQGVGENAAEWAKIAPQYLDQFSPSFLWIKNLWVADVPWKSTLMSAKDFATQAKVTVDAAMVYEPMMAPFSGLDKANGYLIFPILAAGSSLLMQLITQKTQKTQMEMQGQSGTMKAMMWMMPIMMGVFAIQWSSAFAIYLIINSTYSLISTVVINKAVEARFEKEVEANKPAFKR